VSSTGSNAFGDDEVHATPLRGNAGGRLGIRNTTLKQD